MGQGLCPPELSVLHLTLRSHRMDFFLSHPGLTFRHRKPGFTPRAAFTETQTQRHASPPPLGGHGERERGGARVLNLGWGARLGLVLAPATVSSHQTSEYMVWCPTSPRALSIF